VDAALGMDAFHHFNSATALMPWSTIKAAFVHKERRGPDRPTK
jgi:hypothetical protein